jgi:NADH-quinone oxidoreductase subunit I
MARFLPSTLGNLFSAPATRPYPFSVREPFDRARGHLEIDIDKCIFCRICAKKCPSNAIDVDKEVKRWTLAAFQCIICEACVDACPKKALEVKNVYRAPSEVKLVEAYAQGSGRSVAECTTRAVGDYALFRNLYYFPGHTWARADGPTVRIGIDDFAARILRGLKALELKSPGDVIDAGGAAVSFTVGEHTAVLASPVEVRILQRNEGLSTDPSCVVRDPYGEGWIYEAAALNPYEDFRKLHFGASAERWLRKDIDRLYEVAEKDLGVTAADGGVLADELGGRLSADAWRELTRQFFSVSV